MPELYVGLISGTSMDGVDAVVLEESSSVHRIICSQNTPYPALISVPLKQLAQDANISVDQLGETDRLLGDFFAEAVINLLKGSDLKPDQITAIGSHGQTIRHQPLGDLPYTLQIGDPNRIAQATGITTVADFRRRDMAVGGEAAPLVPAFHAAAFSDASEPRVIVNIGGIANITSLPNDGHQPITGFDCGPGNTLMDRICLRDLDCHFDRNGEHAAAGSIHAELLKRLQSDPYFSQPFPKSTGPEYFSADWLDQHLNQFPALTDPADILATLAELTAWNIAIAIAQSQMTPGRVLVCGGGAHNKHLLFRLAHHLDCPVETTEAYGIGPDWVEAAAFAWLAKQTLSGLPGNIPSVTGASQAVILGGIYPA